jgi:hypothetical protein
MTKLKDKIQTGLDESRMLVLGAQILIGFAFSANFQPAFRDLPVAFQYLNLLALTLMLITICLLMSSTALHQLTEEGNDSARLHRFTTHIMESVLALFSLGIGADLYVSAGTIVAKTPAAIVATVITLISLGFWYGPHFLVRGNGRDSEGDMNVTSESVMPTAVHDKSLDEVRRANPYLFNDEPQTATVLLAAAFFVGPDIDSLASFTGYPRYLVADISCRMKDSGFWAHGQVFVEHWFDDAMLFTVDGLWQDCLVAGGIMVARPDLVPGTWKYEHSGKGSLP